MIESLYVGFEEWTPRVRSLTVHKQTVQWILSIPGSRTWKSLSLFRIIASQEGHAASFRLMDSDH